MPRARNRNGIIHPRVAKLGSEEKSYAVERGTTIQELLDMAGIDGGITTVKLGNKTIDDFDTPLNTDVRIVAIPNIKGGSDSESEELEADAEDTDTE